MMQPSDNADIFSFNSKEAELEEFDENGSTQPDINRYSKSPKDNTSLL